MTEHAREGQGPQQPVDPFAPPDALPWGLPPPAYGPQPVWPQQPWPSYPGPYTWGPGSHPGPRTTNPWAVVALVTGILAVVPVAVGSGITALVQVRRRGQSGMGLAIGGIVAAGVWTLVGLLAAVGFLIADGSGGSLGRVADAGATSVGSCFRAPTGDQSIGTEVDCAGAHDAEVYSADALEGETWPGYDTIDERADDRCYDAFEGYVGTSYDSSDYDYGYFVPDQAEWAAGEHRVVCVVLPWDQDTLRGSVRDNGR